MGNSPSVLESITSFSDINDVQKALLETPDSAAIDVVQAFHACAYLATTCQRLQCILELFLKHGVDVNAMDPQRNNWTILHHMFVAQKTFVLPYLLARGARPMRDVNGLAPHDYLHKSKHDHYVRAYLETTSSSLSEHPSSDPAFTEPCVVQIVHDWKRDTHELGELLHVKCKGAPGYVQLIYHENDSPEGLQEEAVFDQFIQVEKEKTISFSTAHLPAQAVVHVLYVACDKHMMHRQVQASDGPLSIQANVEKYVFTVNGEAFHHANPVLDGIVFPTMREFQQFMKMMKSDKLDAVRYEDEAVSNQEDTSDASPSDNETSTTPNQDDEKPSACRHAELPTDQASSNQLTDEASSNQLECDV
ncbi:hypothetical protein SPRG_06998 [Saprolegnia parasitica CBS 223.65]|uniref:Uncharacterized protein n=1 Tax=Saprolegnia parasitica (strain CBS 223.65) TaxID=695850 RepID=A0A067CLI5_SAPPC|nr:hypothetical protein SPRG_06998 [Saprolegnia parasitica CBS 223.65]KDO27411.1 hypothetical protein SPRG_06998 [Saprolegnia parasitica CBS 223.65]|eukprot:XP_012201851.1 hypothetical protein SPRG_06998 [Saprolegnia parasitica CBS 223.65]